MVICSSEEFSQACTGELQGPRLKDKATAVGITIMAANTATIVIKVTSRQSAYLRHHNRMT